MMNRVRPGFTRIICTLEQSKLDYLKDVWSEDMVSRIVTRCFNEVYKRERNSDPAPNHFDFDGDE